ncbi:alpha/beta fold hydrolase [Pullulanibacillus sp. KACC 23026]|uniref:alpha/beta hydrolase n=1 Tax=Pullulanibacillus sp. KACC 23026 TaxID=3028315 RepID=UPI0023AFD35B|nr:alpha/beta fold hydrolase [Pullulanibacillus sp. KACC 23026]WEG13553.1 alpha/beta fold hydrolase [Pullulanibacillus sp. KACC 23026]
MKVVAPEPFTYKGGQRAVLLLHGFTGSSRDVRQLGRFLQKNGYTCHAPIYKGHGVGPHSLLETGPEEWWQSVIEGCRFLRENGYQEMAIAGLSLGAIFSLKAGLEWPVKGIVSMSAHVLEREPNAYFQRVLDYARRYKTFEGKSDDQIADEMWQVENSTMPSLKELQTLVLDIGRHLESLTVPILILQGKLDEPIYQESADILYKTVSSLKKEIRWFEQSGHLLTIDKEKEEAFEAVVSFLNSLEWES